MKAQSALFIFQAVCKDVPLVYGHDFTFFRVFTGEIEMSYYLKSDRIFNARLIHRKLFEPTNEGALEARAFLMMVVVGNA